LASSPIRLRNEHSGHYTRRSDLIASLSRYWRSARLARPNQT